MTDRTTRNWHKAIIADAEQKLGRKLTDDEARFITSRGGFVALEMIHDTIKAGTKEEIISYLSG
jgi:microsomal dipeptidase-like Zn-dependent dipeptidase